MAAAVLAPLPVALAWPPGTCEPSKDKNCVVDVSIAKTSDRDTYAPGDVATYTITVTNTGNTAVDRARIAVSDPALTDLAPTGATTGWLSPGQTLQWTGTRALTTAECGQLPNTATVSLLPAKNAGPPDSNAGNDTATRTVVVGGEKCTPPVAVVPIAQSPTVVTPPVGTTQVAGVPAADARRRGARPAEPQGRQHHQVPRDRPDHGQDRHQGDASGSRCRPGSPSPAPASRSSGTGSSSWGSAPSCAARPRTVPVLLKLDRSARGAKTMKASVSANCGAAAAAVRTVQAVAVAPARVQPAVTG